MVYHIILIPWACPVRCCVNCLRNYKNISSNTPESLQEMQRAGKGVKLWVSKRSEGPCTCAMTKSTLPLSASLSLAPATHSSSLQHPIRENSERERDQTTPGLRHRQVHGWRKSCARKQNQEFTSCFPHRWVFISPQENKAPFWETVTWGHNAITSSIPPLPASLPSFQSDSSSTWSGNPLESSQGHLSQLCVSPFLVLPQPLTVGAEWGTGKVLALGRNKNLLECSLPKSKLCPREAPGKEVNSFQPKQSLVPTPSTRGWHCQCCAPSSEASGQLPWPLAWFETQVFVKKVEAGHTNWPLKWPYCPWLPPLASPNGHTHSQHPLPRHQSSHPTDHPTAHTPMAHT